MISRISCLRIVASAAVPAMLIVTILGGAITLLWAALVSAAYGVWCLAQLLPAWIEDAKRPSRRLQLAIISHEVRTQLNSVVGFARLLKQETSPEKQDEYRNLLHRSAELSLSIFNNALDFIRLEAGELVIERQPVNLRQLIGEAQNMLAPQAREKGLRQATQVHRNVPVSLPGDPLRIRQVLTNLIGNAIKFTERGSVVVRAHLLEQHPAGMTVKITVTDTGAGLSRAEQQRLFTAFTQVDKDGRRRALGAGLGLAICKRLVTGMGGTIGLTSAPGKGSTFWFTLPIGRDTGTPLPDSTASSIINAPPAPGTSDNPAITPGYPPRILVVDDHPVNLRLTGLLLERMGCNITLAHNGQEALALFARQPFDLVFLDRHMPVMDGLETVRRIRAQEDNGRHTPVILLTAEVTSRQHRQLLIAGIDDHLDKPLDENQLHRSLQRWLPHRLVPTVPISAKASTPGGAAARLGNASVIDPALALRRSGQDQSLADDLLSLLLKSLEEEADAFGDPAGLDDRDILLERVHRLHGATRCCGTPGLENAVGQLERALRENADDQRLRCLIIRLLAEIRCVQQVARPTPEGSRSRF